MRDKLLLKMPMTDAVVTPDAAPVAPRTPGRRVWVAAVTAVVAAALVAGGRWGLRHPLPTTWDEAHYDQFLWHDHVRFARGGVRKLVAGLVHDDVGRPPAYRLLVAPWTLWAGVDFAQARVIAVGWLAVTAGVVTATVGRLTRSPAAAVTAAGAAVLTAKVFGSTIHFGTEYALYAGTAITFAGLFLDWDRPRAGRLGWVVLAAGLATAVLSKASALTVVGLPVLLTVAFVRAGRLRGPSVGYVVKAVVAAVVVAGPWWVLNARAAVGVARAGVAFQRRTFGPPSPRAWGRYLAETAHYEIGLPVAGLMLAALAAAVWRSARRSPPAGWPAAAASVAAVDYALVALVLPAVVTIGLQMISVNQDGRLVSHAYVAVAVATGLAVARVGWLRTTAGRAAVGGVLALQAVLLAGPPGVVAAINLHLPLLAVGHHPILRDWEMWDWQPLRAACDGRGLRQPTVGLLGQSFCFNTAQVEVPWAHDDLRPKVVQLWKWEDRNFSLDRTVAAAGRCDVVVTVPGLLGSPVEHEELDNQYNRAVAARLAADPAFGPPVRMTMGRLEPVEVDVFVRRRGG